MEYATLNRALPRSYPGASPSLRFATFPHDVHVTSTRAASGGLRMSGYAVVYDTLSLPIEDSFFEKFARGSLDQYLAKPANEVRALIEHDPSKLLGRRSTGSLVLRSDSKGLHFDLQPADTSYCRDMLELMRRGEMRNMSFGFGVIDDVWDSGDELPIRTVRQAQICEISFVGSPAYPSSTCAIGEATARALNLKNSADVERERLEIKRLYLKVNYESRSAIGLRNSGSNDAIGS